jgi:hypothetical protein
LTASDVGRNPLSNRALKEGSWEAEKLGTWELAELFFAAGVIFFVNAEKIGKSGRFTGI